MEHKPKKSKYVETKHIPLNNPTIQYFNTTTNDPPSSLDVNAEVNGYRYKGKLYLVGKAEEEELPISPYTGQTYDPRWAGQPLPDKEK